MDTRFRPRTGNINQDFDAGTLGAARYCNRVQDVDDPTRREATQFDGSLIEVGPVQQIAPCEAVRESNREIIPSATSRHVSGVR